MNKLFKTDIVPEFKEEIESLLDSDVEFEEWDYSFILGLHEQDSISVKQQEILDNIIYKYLGMYA